MTRRPEDRSSPIHTKGVPRVSPPAPASILYHFRDLPDPRRETRNKKHHLIDILVIALCGTIAGCHSAVEIAAYGLRQSPAVEDLPLTPQWHPLPRHFLPGLATARCPQVSRLLRRLGPGPPRAHPRASRADRRQDPAPLLRFGQRPAGVALGQRLGRREPPGPGRDPVSTTRATRSPPSPNCWRSSS